ncbi:MAG: hypothetical protein KAX65_05100 [Caldilineaceae bacterium]|nr:hypothetical protein [Caldilineaceae bacterium]
MTSATHWTQRGIGQQRLNARRSQPHERNIAHAVQMDFIGAILLERQVDDQALATHVRARLGGGFAESCIERFMPAKLVVIVVNLAVALAEKLILQRFAARLAKQIETFLLLAKDRCHNIEGSAQLIDRRSCQRRLASRSGKPHLYFLLRLFDRFDLDDIDNQVAVLSLAQTDQVGAFTTDGLQRQPLARQSTIQGRDQRSGILGRVPVRRQHGADQPFSLFITLRACKAVGAHCAEQATCCNVAICLHQTHKMRFVGGKVVAFAQHDSKLAHGT